MNRGYLIFMTLHTAIAAVNCNNCELLSKNIIAKVVTLMKTYMYNVDPPGECGNNNTDTKI